MARPSIAKITPFDANNDNEIAILWSGNRACANRIIIQDNNTNDTVFDDMVSSFSLKHRIPAHVLQNGKQYVVQAQVYDMNNIPSALSSKVLFRTFATPEFYFENLNANPIIDNSSFVSSIVYAISSQPHILVADYRLM